MQTTRRVYKWLRVFWTLNRNDKNGSISKCTNFIKGSNIVIIIFGISLYIGLWTGLARLVSPYINPEWPSHSTKCGEVLIGNRVSRNCTVLTEYRTCGISIPHCVLNGNIIGIPLAIILCTYIFIFKKEILETLYMIGMTILYLLFYIAVFAIIIAPQVYIFRDYFTNVSECIFSFMIINGIVMLIILACCVCLEVEYNKYKDRIDSLV